MKTIIFIVLFSVMAFSQSPEDICKERGHLLTGLCGVTLMYCPPQIIDLPDKTIKIYWDRNYKRGFCERCGKEIYEPVQEKPDTVIIWQREIRVQE